MKGRKSFFFCSCSAFWPTWETRLGQAAGNWKALSGKFLPPWELLCKLVTLFLWKYERRSRGRSWCFIFPRSSSPELQPPAEDVRLHGLALFGSESKLWHQLQSVLQRVTVPQLTCRWMHTNTAGIEMHKCSPLTAAGGSSYKNAPFALHRQQGKH